MEATIHKYCKVLKLGSLVAGMEAIKYENEKQYIRDLLYHEIKEREINRVNRNIKTAGFKVLKTLDAFSWNSDIMIPETISKEEIEDISFINKKENLILMGAVGTGKTHLASALALESCRKGKKVKFFTAAELANILIDKNQKGTLSTFMRNIDKMDLIIIDEIGFVPLHRDGAELIFQVISACYERRSLIITSNLEFSGWNTVFGDTRLTTAIVDRLIHHSNIIVFSGESYRLKHSINRQK